MNELYTKILDVTGDAMEFGTRWGKYNFMAKF